MLSPEQQQICLLKYNLEEIENDLITQWTAVPSLDAENEQQYRKTMAAVRVARSCNEETDRLNLENIKLAAKRIHLQRQCEDVTNALEGARQTRIELEEALKEEEQKMVSEVDKYVDTLQKLADCFRKSRPFNEEQEIKNEIEAVNEMIFELKKKQQSRQTELSDLKCKLSGLVNNVPENILSIVGQEELDKKLQSLCDECETLRSQLPKYRAGVASTSSRIQ